VYVCPLVFHLKAVRNISRETGTQWGSLSSEMHGSSPGKKIPCHKSWQPLITILSYMSAVHTCPQLSIPVSSCLHLSETVHTCPYLSILVHTCPHLYTNVHTCSQLSVPVHSCLHLSTTVHTCPNLSIPVHT